MLKLLVVSAEQKRMTEAATRKVEQKVADQERSWEPKASNPASVSPSSDNAEAISVDFNIPQTPGNQLLSGGCVSTIR
jgi:hypothetical protein